MSCDRLEFDVTAEVGSIARGERPLPTRLALIVPSAPPRPLVLTPSSKRWAHQP